MKPLFLAVGHTGLRVTSPDGKTWSAPVLGKEGETYRAAAAGNGRLVTVGSYGGANITAATADGTKWITGSQDAKYVRYVRGLGFGKGTFLGLGGDPGSVGLARPFAVFTADGEKWDAPLDIPGKFLLRRVAFGNDRFVAVGDRGRRAASPDGKTWTDAPEVKAIDTLVDVAVGNGFFVGVGLHGLRARSPDGITWTDRQTGEEGEHLNAVVWAKDRFVAVGAGATYTSYDGAKWQRHPNADAPVCVAFGGGGFVGAKWKGRVLHSADGIQWEETLHAEHHVEAVAFGELG